MQTVLGIDAAWTASEPSGVALVQGQGASWRVLAAAPSYAAFLDQLAGKDVDWLGGRFVGELPPVGALVKAAEGATGFLPTVVAIDMPMATVPILSRRTADQAISSAFGGMGCAAHSPGPDRPGVLGARMTVELEEAGFPLRTTVEHDGRPQTIEVYPHPALLALLDRGYRVPYKVSKSGRYWRGESVEVRIERLLTEFHGIHIALEGELGVLGFYLPSPCDVPTLSSLKRYEDTLDALVCAWVGVRHLRGSTTAFGDSTGAVWVPERGGG